MEHDHNLHRLTDAWRRHLHNVLSDDQPTTTDRQAALAFVALVERFTGKAPVDHAAIAALEVAEGIRQTDKRPRDAAPDASVRHGRRARKCGNCHTEIDWNAVRQCLYYRGPVIGATHRELDDEDRRTRRRIAERIRQKDATGATTPA